MANQKTNKSSKREDKAKNTTNKNYSFVTKAKKKGITTAQLQANVEKNPDEYDEKTKKEAKLRETLVRLNKRNKSKG
jgi:hypothetical protein